MRPTIAQLIAFIKLGRFLFLGGGFLMFALGAAIAHYQGIAIDWQVYVIGQAIVTTTQLMVHYSNDYFDFLADQKNASYTYWSGGSRILPNGDLPPRVALFAAIILLIIAIMLTLALPVLVSVGNLVIPLFLLGIGLSWGYSSPPLVLHSNRLGELTASFVVAVLTPLIGYYLQSGKLDGVVFLATLPLALLQLNMLVSVHLPDIDGDAQAGKQTLPVYLGAQRTARLYKSVLVVVYIIIPLLVVAGLPLPVGLSIFVGLPVAFFLAWMLRQQNWDAPRQLGQFAFVSITLLMGTALLEIAGFLFTSR